MSHLEINVRKETLPLKQSFRIARGTVSEGDVVVVSIADGHSQGRGEACPTEHYGETLNGVVSLIGEAASRLSAGEDWDRVHEEMPAGAARNAIDCAVWDWRAKASGRPVWQLLGMRAPRPVASVLTLSLDEPALMAERARAVSATGMLKLKLGAPGDADRVRAVRAAAPEQRLIVDVNEGWTLEELRRNLPVMAECGVEMLEQPLPAGQDEGLAEVEHLVPIGADESCHTSADLARLAPLYEVVNIKLDKTGGLTEAMRLVQGAQAHGLEIMIGCMLGTSLAMAPGVLVAQHARFVDLDAPLLIARDRMPGLEYCGDTILPPLPGLWG
ncbi:MAG: N-acetyl-D-Glu racemase DgcA [Haliea sp.]